MPVAYVSTFVGMVVAVAIALGPSSGHAAQGAVGSPSAEIRSCSLRLSPPSGGSPRFAIPKGGRATARPIVGSLLLCTLLRADGSRFAYSRIDRLGRVLDVRFFRRSGTLRFAADASYAAATSQPPGADVRCDSDAYEPIGKRFWQRSWNWWVGKTPGNLAPDKVVKALRSAYSEWGNNINWCGYTDNAKVMAEYQGRTDRRSTYDGKNVVEWGSLEDVQNCGGALACTSTWYDEKGDPVESDVRFNIANDWSIDPAAGDFDIQSVAAHEFGHVRQFDHVESNKAGDNTVVMWPYIAQGDTSLRKLGRGDSLGDNAKY
jgi:Matrixin